jgi:transposase, IS30 family
VVRFSYRMVPEVYQVFWAGMAAGEFINDAAIAAGSYGKQGSRWLAAVGGVRPGRGRNLKGGCLRFGQRAEIAIGRACGDSIRAIAALIGRSPSTVSRESCVATLMGWGAIGPGRRMHWPITGRRGRSRRSCSAT